MHFKPTIYWVGFSLLLVCSQLCAKEYTIAPFDIAIDVPQGFTKAENFTGFVQPESFTTIKVNETNQAFAATVETFVQHADEIETRETTKISDHSAVIFKGKSIINDHAFGHWTLIFGDSISTITVSATYPTHLAPKLDVSLKQTLLTTRWLRLPSQQLFQGLPFVLDETPNLTLVERTGNSVILRDKTPYDESHTVIPIIIVSAVTSELAIDDIKTFAHSALRNKRFRDRITISKEESVMVNNVPGYHITALAIDNKTGAKVTLYQTIAYQRFRYLLAIGIVERQQASQFVPQFAQAVASLKFKTDT